MGRLRFTGQSARKERAAQEENASGLQKDPLVYIQLLTDQHRNVR